MKTLDWSEFPILRKYVWAEKINYERVLYVLETEYWLKYRDSGKNWYILRERYGWINSIESLKITLKEYWKEVPCENP